MDEDDNKEEEEEEEGAGIGPRSNFRRVKPTICIDGVGNGSIGTISFSMMLSGV